VPDPHVNGLAVNGSEQVAIATDAGRVYIWNAHAGVRLEEVPALEPAWSVTFDPKGTLLAAGGIDGVVRVADLSRRVAAMQLHGHEARVLGLAFSADGQRLASASDDATVRVWDVARRGGTSILLLGHNRPVVSTTFDRSADNVISASLDGTVRIWTLSTAQLAEQVCRRVMRTTLEEGEWQTLVGSGLDASQHARRYLTGYASQACGLTMSSAPGIGGSVSRAYGDAPSR
jgi:WD40 repeat protein